MGNLFLSLEFFGLCSLNIFWTFHANPTSTKDKTRQDKKTRQDQIRRPDNKLYLFILQKQVRQDEKDKTRQDMSRQDKTGQNKNKTGQDMPRQDKTRQR